MPARVLAVDPELDGVAPDRRVVVAEGLPVPDTVPSDLTEQYSREFGRVNGGEAAAAGAR